MGSQPPAISSASVSNILTLLASRDAHLAGGAGGLERRVTWASRMRARLPAFESIQGGELALLALPQLHRLGETLPHLLKSLHHAGVAAVAVAAASLEALGEDAIALANMLHFPLILLPATAHIEEIEREVIYFVVSFRGEIERKAADIAQRLMQFSIQGADMESICEQLANSTGKWVTVQNADLRVRLQAIPAEKQALNLPAILTDEALWEQSLTRVVAPILIRHETVGYLSLIANDGDFDYLERITLGQVVPILALAFARERERSEVEGRYSAEAFTDVVQGNYQQPEEMLARTRLLGYDLTSPQAIVIFELAAIEPDYATGSPRSQWNRRVREELLRDWPTSWIYSEARRVSAFLPLNSNTTNNEDENAFITRLERVQMRIQQSGSNSTSNDNGIPLYSVGIGRIAKNLRAIPQAYREAQQALEIGQKLFGEGKLHSFAQLGIYRLLFHLNGQGELREFYQETLGPLLAADTRGDGAFIETLECFFRCNGNLSETARAMHFHRNSLLYRLSRIEEILGRSLEDSELRLSLQIALKIRHLL
ncbi:MAG TPA: helix-turn-helix domain-containing protein [Ktedonobacteraceae bacterium]|nr:helix-turn-helix domain-containing protein [Ktedonobacteraceae bacterium]